MLAWQQYANLLNIENFIAINYVPNAGGGGKADTPCRNGVFSR
jgi:hypothetical protein